MDEMMTAGGRDQTFDLSKKFTPWQNPKSLLLNPESICIPHLKNQVNKSTPLGVHHEESGLPACPERTWFASATGKARGNTPQVCKSVAHD